jgi:hypothetical protein
MTVELWAALAALCFSAAALSSGLARIGQRGAWRRLVVPARAAGLIALAIAVALAIGVHGEPSPFDLRQVALGLGLAASAAGFGLAWRHGVAGAGPVQDLVMVGLVLVAILAIRPGGSALNCMQRWLPFWLYWGLFVLGAGELLLAGSVAWDLALEAIWPGDRRWAVRANAHRLLTDAMAGALVTLGGGLTISVWWSWRTMGSLSGGDSRQIWMGATWLVGSMSLLAWQSERRGARIAAALAFLAALMALFGLLAVPDLQRLWSL